VRAGDWGVDPLDAAALLAGSSPASRGDGELPPWRLVTGYDVDERCARELPERPATAHGLLLADPTLEAKLRDTVPEGEREEWDLRLSDARATYGVRDDNGLFTAAWPVGLLRRAMLEAGSRLATRARLHDTEHAVELTVDELVAALRNGDAPDADAAAARKAARQQLSRESAPPAIGPPLDPPLSALPAPMRLLMRALLALRELGITQPGARPALTGVGIGDAPVIGRALVVGDPADAFARFEPGDILVTSGTCPAWNALLALAGGVVTEEGGPLSHAAVIARELGLPALIGTAEATTLVTDGATIELDPQAGTVRVLSRD
jgi:phosphohistidine swiveling domain-containing protein